MPRTPYSNLWERLVANTAEPSNSNDCWRWSARLRKWYGRIDVYVPGLGKNVTLTAHVAAWVWLHAEPKNIDEFYLAYIEFRESGLELDHQCNNTTCIYPDHLLPVDGPTNCYMRELRKRHPR